MINKKIYSWVKHIWHATYIRLRDGFNDWKYSRYWNEHMSHNGREHTDKIFYIIRRREVYTGLLSDLITYVYKTKLAVDAGYIPVIDMQTSENIYLKEDEVGKINAWEYYFKQPGGYSLRDIEKARNVILGSGYTEECFPYLDVNYILNKVGNFSVYQSITKSYFHLSSEAEEIVENFYNQNFKGQRMLGILCRGTDYTQVKPSKHPVQPSPEEMFVKVREVLDKYKCTKIFLGTEDADIYSRFKEKYGDIVITNRKYFIKYNGEQSIGKVIKSSTDNLKEEGMEYLVTIALLARCDCFVGGHTSGTVGVMLMNDRFEYKYIFDLGVYP